MEIYVLLKGVSKIDEFFYFEKLEYIIESKIYNFLKNKNVIVILKVDSSIWFILKYFQMAKSEIL